MGNAARAAGKITAIFALAIAVFAGSASAQCIDPMQTPLQTGVSQFTQTRHLQGVRAPLVSRGQANVTRERVEWRVSDPIEVLTTITPQGVTQSVDGGAPQRLGPQSGGGDPFLSSTGLFDLLTGDFAALRTHYDVATLPGGGGGAWRLAFTPKSATLARYISRIEVAGCTRVAHVSVNQANGDRMDIDWAS
ncbi:MAG: hypothetical protein ABW199_05300 [Caulobacterales bacterium]